MKKTEMLETLSALKEYSTDMVKGHQNDDEMLDIYTADVEALSQAEETINTSLNMLHDIFENLAGQDLFNEMVTILMNKGYTKEDFDIVGINIEGVEPVDL